MTMVRTWTGREARALRTALRLSGRAFAEHLGVSYRAVAEWDRRGAEITPGEQAKQLLDIALSRASEEQKQLFAALLPKQEEPDEDMDRRQLLRTLTLAGAAVSLSALSEGLDRVAHPGPLDAAAMSSFESITDGLWQVYRHADAKATVYPAVRSHVDALTAQLSRPQTLEVRRRLCLVLANALQLIGEIQFDRDHYADAARCYSEAANAGREARDADLWACAMVRHAFISLYERRFADAVPLLEMAGRAAERGDRTLPTRHWVSAVTAQALAGMRDLDGCRQAWDRAAEVTRLPMTGPPATGWLRFSGDRLAEERGTSYVELGRPDLAEPVLVAALAASTSARRRGGVHVDLSAVGAQRRDKDQFAAHVHAAVEIARQTDSGYLARRVRGLRLWTAGNAELNAFLNERTTA
ncbi:transcriptional regulator [Allokutzneria multivorans]